MTGVVVRSTLATASPVLGVATSTKFVLYHREIGRPLHAQADRDKVAEAAKNMTIPALSPSFRDAPRVARTDGLGAFELRGLSTAPSELFVCFTPWHVEAVKVAPPNPTR